MNRLQRSGMKPPIGGENAEVAIQRASGSKVEGLTGQIGYPPTGLLDDNGSGRLIPDSLNVIRPARRNQRPRRTAVYPA